MNGTPGRQDDGEPTYKHTKTMAYSLHSLLLKLDPISTNQALYILAYDKYDKAQRNNRVSSTILKLLHTLLTVWCKFVTEDSTKQLQECVTPQNAFELYTTTFDTGTMQTLRKWLIEFTTPSTLPASTLPLPPGMLRPSLLSQSMTSAVDTSLCADPENNECSNGSPEVLGSSSFCESTYHRSNGLPTPPTPATSMQQHSQALTETPGTSMQQHSQALTETPGTPCSSRSLRQSYGVGSLVSTDDKYHQIHSAKSNWRAGSKVIKLETYNLSDVEDVPDEDWNKSRNSCQSFVYAEESSEVWRLSQELREAIEEMLENQPDYEYTKKRRSHTDM